MYHLRNIDEGSIQKWNNSDGPSPQSPVVIDRFSFYRRSGEMLWASGCAFYDNYINNKTLAKPQLCADFCARDPKCFRFTWNPSIDNGTCTLKTRFPLQATPRMVQNCICGYKESMVCLFIIIMFFSLLNFFLFSCFSILQIFDYFNLS